MIIFKRMQWSNFFSYGKDNSIDFNKTTVTQLLGQNGVGKTSIPIILQEVLYGKNVKKIAKAKLFNRNIEAKEISASVWFSVDEVEYKLSYSRNGSKVVLVLFKDEEDISSHTAPATLKSIENILRMDFDTFSQLIYQSSKSSLEFLTSTDTQRKKFLITLFNLEAYTELHEVFKNKLGSTNLELSNVQGKYDIINGWLEKHSSIIFKEMDLKEVPEAPDTEIAVVHELESKKNDATNINKRINKNNTYKRQLETLDKSMLHSSLKNPRGIATAEANKISLTAIKNEKQKLIKVLSEKSDICPTCKQSIDISESKELEQKYRAEMQDIEKNLSDTITNLKFLHEELDHDNKIKKVTNEFETITNLIDDEVPDTLIDVEDINSSIQDLQTKILKRQKDIKEIQEYNVSATVNNTNKQTHEKQLKEYSDSLKEEMNKLEELFTEIEELEIIKEALSTNGIVSYKLEYLTKDLEIVINEYLEELSRGQFQLSFALKGDKLNIDVYDYDSIISINELSEGELAKINVSTLLAIRRLMQSLSNTKLNVLFLDEIMGVLDDIGREDLITVLLSESSLNTFLVTHSYTHPLVPKLTITKEDRISRITDE